MGSRFKNPGCKPTAKELAVGGGDTPDEREDSFSKFELYDGKNYASGRFVSRQFPVSVYPNSIGNTIETNREHLALKSNRYAAIRTAVGGILS